MSNTNTFCDFVFSLSRDEFNLLQDAVTTRLNKEKYNATNFIELAESVGRPVICPNCGSDSYVLNGHTPNGKQRYKCKQCGNVYGLLTNSIFNSANISFNQFIQYIVLMTFNVPLVMLEELCGISSNTSMLWRKKIFQTVNGYQERIKLRDTVWFDETYITDAAILHEDGDVKKRGLSKQQICIVVAIDKYENVYANICGHGKPTKQKVYNALKDHIEPGSDVFHDGDKSHSKLISKLGLESHVYIANTKSPEYLENMALINNLCSWIKRYLYRFIGMDLINLQSYLNWFVYLFRVNSDKMKWPKVERILRHLALEFTTYTRKY